MTPKHETQLIYECQSEKETKNSWIFQLIQFLYRSLFYELQDIFQS